MIPRPGNYSPQGSRKLRPLDAVLGQPSAPPAGGVGTTGQITGPVSPPLAPQGQQPNLSLEQRQAIMQKYQETGELPEGIQVGQMRPTGPTTTGKGATAPGALGPGGGLTSGTPIDAVLGEGGEENPWLNPFMEVYEATKTGAMKNLGDIQKQMGESFAHRGGYFGGKHAISQSDVASKTGSYLDQLLAETSLGASEREYEDWQRARQEEFMPMNLLSTLLGQDTFENIVSQPGQSPLGDILSSLIAAGGTIGGAAVSSKEFKKDISGIEEEEENRIFEQMKKVPLFNYRYKFEPDDNVKHVGLITEESPGELTLFNKKAVGLYEYISMLHATIKVMGRKLEKLEGRN